jgi:hypothetical protein
MMEPCKKYFELIEEAQQLGNRWSAGHTTPVKEEQKLTGLVDISNDLLDEEAIAKRRAYL